MKTAFDDYDCPADIVLYDPCPPSWMRMVFLTTDKSQGPQGRLLGSIFTSLHEIKVVPRKGAAGPTVRDISAGIRLLRELR